MTWWKVLLLVVCCLYSSVTGNFLIRTIPSNVEIGITDGVRLECSFRGDPSSSLLQSVTRVRILKEVDQFDFQIVAEARDVEPTLQNIGLDKSANLTGFVGDVASSYLSVYWDQVTSNILGRYRCDVVGFRANQDVYIERTPVFVLEQGNVTIQDVIDLTNRHKAELEQEINAQKTYCDNRISQVEASIDAKIAAIKLEQDNSSKEFEARLLQEISVMSVDVKRLMDTGVLQYWPEGLYALLMPNSGCPNDVGAQWKVGWRRFHTESSDRNYDEISEGSHLKQPALERILTNNFLYQHFCVSNVLSPGAEWPRGAYCINKFGDWCPGGFSSGSITWQDEVINSAATVYQFLPSGEYAINSTVIDYCCRNDGPADDPIYLPKSRPFYLYRFNGTCQEVVGMRSFPEYVIFDTDNSNDDAYENSFHPDGSINNVRIELCYYEEAV